MGLGVNFDQNVINDQMAGVTIRIEGLTETLQRLADFGAATEDMRDLMHSTGQIVIDAANPPVVSGRLASSMRAGRGKTKAVVRAGSPVRAPHAAIVHYPYQRPYLAEALRVSGTRVFSHISQGLIDLQRKNNLL